MKKSKSRYLGIGFGVFAVGVLLLPYVITNFGQTEGKDGLKAMPTATPDQIDETAKAREALAKSVEGSLVLQTITIKEPEWKLTKGYFSEFKSIPEEPVSTRLSFENGDSVVHVNIARLDSEEQAKERFLRGSQNRSHGFARPAKFGDQGEKVYLQTGAFLLLRFRIKNHTVTVSTRADEKLAEKFAEYVLESIS